VKNLEKTVRLAQDARLVAMNDNVVFPMLDKFAKDTMSKMVSLYKSGQKDFLGEVAYLAALNDLRVKFEHIQTNGNRAFEKLNNKE